MVNSLCVRKKRVDDSLSKWILLQLDDTLEVALGQKVLVGRFVTMCGQ